MKAVFYIFSGTGNTKRIAKLFANEFEKSGIESTFVDIVREQGEFPLPSEFDRVCLCYPIHGFNAPELLLNFAKSLPSGNQNYYVIKSSGEPLKINSASSYKLQKILGKKGYKLAGEFWYIMPYNMIFRHSDGMVRQMWESALRGVPKDAPKIINGEDLDVKFKAIPKMVRSVVSIEHPAMHFIGKGFKVKKDKCIKCMKCVRNCPCGNISYDKEKEKFIFGNHCIGCVRCSFGCPTSAINIGILGAWKVNGAYNFDNKSEDKTVCRYCHKSYVRYFDSHKEE